ncbi:MAG: site-2 protease family protein [Planctomycetes bacterium]|nr:site-2 protease family protein [Planctomycetota bacterium]
MNFDWSLSLGRWFGIDLRLHLFFFLLVLSRLLNANAIRSGDLKWELLFFGLLFSIVLLHEYGHCIAGIRAGGRAERIVIWPLGGLAYVDTPHDPRARFVTAAGGPLVNVAILLVSIPYILFWGGKWGSYFFGSPVYINVSVLDTLFAMNLDLLLFNLLPVFPLDGGHLLRALLWSRFGFGRGTILAVRVAYVGLGILALLALYSLLNGGGFLLIILVAWMFQTCRMEHVRALEEYGGWDPVGSSWQAGTGGGGGGWAPRRSWLAAWKERREAVRRESEARARIELQAEVDRILGKVSRDGLPSLSGRERRFLKYASRRMRK